MSGPQSLSSIKRWGRFLTPDPIAKVAADWAFQSKSDSLVDVATGEGVFLLYAARRLKELGASKEEIASQIYGAEINRLSCNMTISRLQGSEGITLEHLYYGDFFDLVADRSRSMHRAGVVEVPEAQAVLGNPPFIRYSTISKTTRRKALCRMAESGVDLSGPVDSSVMFLIHASSLISSSGRLALIEPERVLFTSYGSLARNYLKTRFKSVRLVLCNGWSFSQAAERVVLVLATDSGGHGFTIERMNFDSERRLSGGSPNKVQTLEWKQGWEDLWVRTRLTPKEHDQFKRIMTNPKLHELREFGKVSIGCVTGANDFFVINKELMDEFSLPRSYLHRAVGRARHINGLVFDNQDWLKLLRSNERCLLLAINDTHKPTKSVEIQRYLRQGLRSQIQERYKLIHRDKWYKVPRCISPDAFFTYMSHHFPRLVINETRAINLNSIHSVRLNVPDKIAFCTGFYNSLTLLWCELMGRVYSGGVLKIEPGELKDVMVTDPVELGLTGALDGIYPAVNNRLIRGDLDGVLDIVDPLILGQGLGLKGTEIQTLRESLAKMREVRLGGDSPAATRLS